MKKLHQNLNEIPNILFRPQCVNGYTFIQCRFNNKLRILTCTTFYRAMSWHQFNTASLSWFKCWMASLRVIYASSGHGQQDINIYQYLAFSSFSIESMRFINPYLSGLLHRNLCYHIVDILWEFAKPQHHNKLINTETASHGVCLINMTSGKWTMYAKPSLKDWLGVVFLKPNKSSIYIYEHYWMHLNNAHQAPQIMMECNAIQNPIWVRSRNCGCLVTWFCYQLIAKPGNKTATISWPDSYV